MRIFLAINQNFTDGTAHSLYFLRHSWWLAKTRPNVEVVMIHTRPHGVDGSRIGPDALDAAGLGPLPNLRFQSLPVFDFKLPFARTRISRFFYGHVAAFLKIEAKKGDVFFTASFPAMFSFIVAHSDLREKMLMVYEVHALRELDDLLDKRMIRRERKALREADWLVCTTQSLEEIVRRLAPGKETFISGFGCGLDAARFPPRTHEPLPEDAVIGFIGSVYRIQGIMWLAENWERVRSACGPLTLRIFGGNEADLQKLREHTSDGVEIIGPVPSGTLPTVTRDLHAMVIPSLNSGRMPLVVITKAYDYPAIGLPVVASAISSIEEVLTDEVNALLFTPGDIESFCATLLKLRQPGRSAQLVERALQRGGELSWQARNERFWQALEIRNH